MANTLHQILIVSMATNEVIEILDVGIPSELLGEAHAEALTRQVNEALANMNISGQCIEVPVERLVLRGDIYPQI